MEFEIPIADKIAEYRIKALNKTLTLAEMREGIQYLRSLRVKATDAARKKGTSKKVINSDQLLDDLEGL